MSDRFFKEKIEKLMMNLNSPQFNRKNQFKYYFLFLFASLFITMPMWRSGNICLGGDMIAHVRFVQSAYVSIFQERTFPLLYINDMGVALQPVFQYYSIVIYVLSAIFMFIGFSAYKSLLIGMSILYGLGAYGIFLILRYFRINFRASLIASLAFLYAPYHFVVLYSRGACAEISALSILPLLFYSLIRLVASRGKKYGIQTAVFTALLLISHKIFLHWAFLMFFVFFVITKKEKSPIKILKYYIFPSVFWVALGMMAMAVYWMPGYLAVNNLDITYYFANITLSDWKLLLTPIYSVSRDSNVPDLATQYGLPIVLSILFSFFLLRKRKIVPAVSVIFFLLFLFESNLGNVLKFVPKLFTILQFPYRLLVLSSLFGSIAVGLVLNYFKDSKKQNAILVLSLILVFGYAFYYRRVPPVSGITEKEAENYTLVMSAYCDNPGTGLNERYKTTGIEREVVEQNALLILDRYKNDEARLFFKGVVPGEIRSQNPYVQLFINDKLWFRKDLTDGFLLIDEFLPSSVEKQQKIRFNGSAVYVPSKVYSFSFDNREIIFLGSKIRVTDKNLIYLKLDQLKAIGSRVMLKLDMQKEAQYVIPVMFSKFLNVNDKRISIIPHKDGVVIKTLQNGFYDLVIERIEFPFIRKISLVFCMVIIFVGLKKLRLKLNFSFVK